MKRFRKPALLTIAILFLMVGGAAAFFFTIQKDVDPVVKADIDAHFAAFDDVPSITNVNSKKTDSHRFSDLDDIPDAKTGSHEKRFKKRGNRLKKGRPPTDKSAKGPHYVGIRKIAAGTWVISRDTYEDARSNVSAYVGNTRAELVKDNTGPIGFRIKNIRKDSALHSIGLRNRDVIVAVNGFPLNSVENVTMALASFQKSIRFRLDILRKQKRRSLYYKITDS